MAISTGKNRTAARSLRAGMTLTELMVAMTIMTVGVLGMIGAFKFFNVGVQAAKTRSLANNIAQERIEYLKNKSYYRILVSTQVDPPDNNYDPPMVYDHAPNGEETVNVGGINFIRRVLIRKVNEDNNGNLTYPLWNSQDTGLKEIKVYVCWYERGEWRKLELRNLRENPARVNKSAEISGTAKEVWGTPIEGVVVKAQESPSQYGVSDSNGYYSFSVEAGTYTLLATKDLYFPKTLPSFGLEDSETKDDNIVELTRRNYTALRGYAYLTGDHLVISQLVSSTETSTGNNEWIEVYNPTTWTWTMATGLGTGTEVVRFSYTEHGLAEKVPNIHYRTASLPPNSYFLFANTGTVTAAGVTRQADAVYDNDGNWTNQDNVIADGAPAPAGTIYIGNPATSWVLDRVGWTSWLHPSNRFLSSGQYETIYLYDTSFGEGLSNGIAFIRKSSYSTVNDYDGGTRCYDRNYNKYDFYVSSPLAYPPYNSSVSEVCTGGQPAAGAVAWLNDGLSSPYVASSNGYFYINYIASTNATWDLFIASGMAFSSVPYYGNPTYRYDDVGSIYLGSTTTYGYVTGRVIKAGLPVTGIYNIKMFAPGSDQVSTNGSGIYTLPVEPGILTVTANYQSQNPIYVELSSMSIPVGLGQVKDGVNFTLYEGGKIRGLITTNGVDPLPNIPVVGIRNGIEQGSGISDEDGYFLISGSGISTGTYIVEPQLELGESCTPSTDTVTVEAGSTTVTQTFTVTGAFGYVTGTVTRTVGVETSSITTGVLVYVTSTTLAAGSDPPNITSSLRSGTGVYYAVSSNALGTYNIPVKGGYSYNVYAWYTTWSGGVPAVTRKQSLGVDVDPMETVTVDFNW